jgi:hypothetical protein
MLVEHLDLGRFIERRRGLVRGHHAAGIDPTRLERSFSAQFAEIKSRNLRKTFISDMSIEPGFTQMAFHLDRSPGP